MATPGLPWFTSEVVNGVDSTRRKTSEHVAVANGSPDSIQTNGRILMLGTVLVVLLVLMLLGSLPTWPHSRNWGYGPTGGLGLVLVILVVMLLLGRV